MSFRDRPRCLNAGGAEEFIFFVSLSVASGVPAGRYVLRKTVVELRVSFCENGMGSTVFFSKKCLNSVHSCCKPMKRFTVENVFMIPATTLSCDKKGLGNDFSMMINGRHLC